MEKIKVVYKPCTEVVFDAPDGAYNDIVQLLLSQDPPKFASSLNGSIYKFALSLEDIVFISFEKGEQKNNQETRFGF